MTKDHFFNLLKSEIQTYKDFLETSDNQWIIKGFVDVNKNVYAISSDTKVVSKIVELLLIPKLQTFAHNNNLELILPSKQNYYPDLTFKDSEGNLFGVDFKTSYYEGDKINGLTLGSYWGYFRFRDKTMNMDYPYGDYKTHLIIGLLYKKAKITPAEKSIYSINELSKIQSVIEDFRFFVQPKWKVASDKPGSGNTRNIGSVASLEMLENGTGPFSDLGEDVFDDYWMGYYNNADANSAGIGLPHYHDIDTYKSYLNSKRELINKIDK